MSTVFCTDCGTRNKSISKFCFKCGNQLQQKVIIKEDDVKTKEIIEQQKDVKTPKETQPIIVPNEDTKVNVTQPPKPAQIAKKSIKVEQPKSAPKSAPKVVAKVQSKAKPAAKPKPTPEAKADKGFWWLKPKEAPKEVKPASQATNAPDIENDKSTTPRITNSKNDCNSHSDSDSDDSMTHLRASAPLFVPQKVVKKKDTKPVKTSKTKGDKPKPKEEAKSSKKATKSPPKKTTTTATASSDFWWLKPKAAKKAAEAAQTKTKAAETKAVATKATKASKSATESEFWWLKEEAKPAPKVVQDVKETAKPKGPGVEETSSPDVVSKAGAKADAKADKVEGETKSITKKVEAKTTKKETDFWWLKETKAAVKVVATGNTKEGESNATRRTTKAVSDAWDTTKNGAKANQDAISNAEEDTKDIVCRWHGSAKGCEYGAQCIYSHAKPNSVKFCKFFKLQWNGGCQWGEKCKFRHKIYEDSSTDVERKAKGHESLLHTILNDIVQS